MNMKKKIKIFFKKNPPKNPTHKQKKQQNNTHTHETAQKMIN